MDNPQLPDNIIPISKLRIAKNKYKRCNCLSFERRYEVDVANREVTCTNCGSVVDAFDALKDIARHFEMIEDEVNRLLNQRKEILKWNPHLVALREVEKVYRSNKYLPSCPHCGRGIEAQELGKGWVSKEYEYQRRKFEEKK